MNLEQNLNNAWEELHQHLDYIPEVNMSFRKGYSAGIKFLANDLEILSYDDELEIKKFTGQSNFECEYHSNGKRKKITKMKDGLKHGTESQFSPDDDLTIITEYFEGKKHGKCIKYWVGTDIEKEIIEYKEDKKCGKHWTYYQDGSIHLESIYNNDKKIQIETEYYESGLRKRITHYANGVKHGYESTFNDYESKEFHQKIFENGEDVTVIVKYISPVKNEKSFIGNFFDKMINKKEK